MKTLSLMVLSSLILTLTTKGVQAVEKDPEDTVQFVLTKDQQEQFQRVMNILNYLPKAHPFYITPPEMLAILKEVKNVTDFKLDDTSKVNLKNAFIKSFDLIDGVIGLESLYSSNKDLYDSIRQFKDDISKKIEHWPDRSNPTANLQIDSPFVKENKTQSSVITNEPSAIPEKFLPQ
jgi:hypothetical protein